MCRERHTHAHLRLQQLVGLEAAAQLQHGAQELKHARVLAHALHLVRVHQQRARDGSAVLGDLVAAEVEQAQQGGVAAFGADGGGALARRAAAHVLRHELERLQTTR